MLTLPVDLPVTVVDYRNTPLTPRTYGYSSRICYPHRFDHTVDLYYRIPVVVDLLIPTVVLDSVYFRCVLDVAGYYVGALPSLRVAHPT